MVGDGVNNSPALAAAYLDVGDRRYVVVIIETIPETYPRIVDNERFFESSVEIEIKRVKKISLSIAVWRNLAKGNLTVRRAPACDRDCLPCSNPTNRFWIKNRWNKDCCKWPTMTRHEGRKNSCFESFGTILSAFFLIRRFFRFDFSFCLFLFVERFNFLVFVCSSFGHLIIEKTFFFYRSSFIFLFECLEKIFLLSNCSNRTRFSEKMFYLLCENKI